VRDENENAKLSVKMKRGVFLGYNDENSKGYRIMELDTNLVKTSRNVIFEELVFPMKQMEIKYGENNSGSDSDNEDSNISTVPISDQNHEIVGEIEPPIETRRNSRVRKPNLRYFNKDFSALWNVVVFFKMKVN
jgi:hypothetical protein